MEKRKKVEMKRNPEVKGKSKVYIPPGAPRLNMKADREEPPTTIYDGIDGDEWLKRVEGKKDD